MFDLVFSPKIWFTRRSPRQLIHVVVVALCVALAVYIQSWFWTWYVEDAAISFGYARNWAAGDGLVSFPGGERVEGYSNPLWVLWMAACELVWIDPWSSSKGGAMVLVGLTVILAYLIVRETRETLDDLPLVGALAMATFPQYALWSASGLENSLFGTLLAGGIWRTLVESRTGGTPWASLWFLGLALTRPEGIVYAAVGGALCLYWDLSKGRGIHRSVWWVGMFWLPFSVYFAARYWYFGFPFPATYYAKLGAHSAPMWSWVGRSWKYIRGYGWETGQGFLIPLMIVGAMGWRRYRWVVACLAIALYGAVVLPGGAVQENWLGIEGWAPPRSFFEYNYYALAGIYVASLVAVLSGEGRRVRMISLLMAALPVLFALRAGGDWMKGYRWLSLGGVQFSLLFTLGVGAIVGPMARSGIRWKQVIAWSLAIGATATWVMPSVQYLSTVKREVTPNMVKRRLNYFHRGMKKLMMEKGVIADHDMGGMLWWGPEKGVSVIDGRGLTDWAHSIHRPGNTPNYGVFIEEYMFRDNTFDFAHAHASTGSAMSRVRRFRTEYVEIPGYGKGLHGGNFMRRSLVFKPNWEGGDTSSYLFGDDTLIYGPVARAKEIGNGAFLVIEVGIKLQKQLATNDERRLWMVLHNEQQGPIKSYELSVGYDDWLLPRTWKASEVFHGIYALRVEDIPKGTYQTSLVWTGADGRVIPAEEESTAPVYARGEQLTSLEIQVVSRSKMKSLSERDVELVNQQSSLQRCEEAEDVWRRARYRRIRAGDFYDRFAGAAHRNLSDCWAMRAADESGTGQLQSLKRARYWDVRSPRLLQLGAEIGAEFFAMGQHLRANGQRGPAIQAYKSALLADPTQSWARRHLEDLRTVDYAEQLKRDQDRRRKRQKDRAAAREVERAKSAENQSTDVQDGPERVED